MPYYLSKVQLPPLNLVLGSKILHSLIVLLQKVLDVLLQGLKYLNLIMIQEVDGIGWIEKEKKCWTVL